MLWEGDYTGTFLSGLNILKTEYAVYVKSVQLLYFQYCMLKSEKSLM
jgi:hypothetical protein